MERKKLLITGSAGLIGGILMARLADDYDIYGLDILASRTDHNFFQADISDFDEVNSVISKIAPIPYVIHLAANPRADAEWQSVLRNNIDGTRNIYETSSIHKIDRVIFASSNHVTGAYEGNPPTLHLQSKPNLISATDEIRPDGPYGISKMSGEAIARYYFDYHHVESACLRFGSVISPDDPTRDKRHLATWLSHSDLTRLIKASLLAKDEFPGFGIYYGVSNNSRRFWNIENAQSELGFVPQDNASKYVGDNVISG
jgi:nucleoside-diphosphate-sugar epimerase